MKKSIFLFFAAILCATSAWGKTIYLKPSSNWRDANAWFQVWDGKSDVTFESTGIDGLYKADISDQHDQYVYIKRRDPNTSNKEPWAQSKVEVSTYNHFSNSGWDTSMTRSNIIGLVTGGQIYFDNAETNWTGNIQFVVGHDSYSRTYEMTQIADTKLWYVNLSDKSNHTWGDAKYYGFIASGSKFGDGNWGSSNLKNATSYTKAYTSTYSLNDGAIYYCKMSATANGSTFSIDYKGSKNDIPKCDATQAAKVRNSKTVAYTNVTNTWPATLTLEGTFLETNSTTKRTSITSTTSTDDASKRVYRAVQSGKITHTYSNLNDDYHFEGWGTEDAPTSTNAPYEYNITANTTVYAFFTKKYAVNFSADANGSVAATADEQALTSGNKVVGGTEVTLTATPNTGYEFVNWTKAGVEVSTEATYSFTVTENVDLVANFLPTYTINVTTDDERGTIEGAGTYTQGAEVTLIAEAKPNYKFLLWRKTGEEVEYSKDNPLSFTATENLDLRAEFVFVQRIVKVTAENGTVTAENGLVISKEASYNHGHEVKLTATPADHYVFVNWTKGEEVVSTEPTYTFTITEDVELVANFALDTHTVAVTAENGTVSGAGSYTHGTEVTLTAAADDGYTFAGWSNGKTTNPYTFEVTEDVTLTANFKLNSYTVTATATKGGTVTGAGTYDHGTSVTLNATPNTGYEFVNWTQEGVEVSADAEYTFTLTNDVDITANFESLTITLTDGDNSAIIAAKKGKKVNVQVNRTFKANDGYYTICLPFDLDDASEIGKAYQVTSISNAGAEGFYMVFNEVTELVAGQPYLIEPKDLTNPIFEDVTIVNTSGETVTATGAGINFEMVGVINGGGQTEPGQYWVGDKGYFYNGDGTQTTAKLGLRVLFNITNTEGQRVNVRARVVVGENTTTGLDNITNGENTTIKVIENGQLVIIRNGEKFNAQGVRL